MSGNTSGHFELTIDKPDNRPLFIKMVDGGFMSHSLVDEAIGSDLQRIKHAAVGDVDPVTFEMGIAGSKSVLEWIQASWNKDYSSRSGQIDHANFNLKTLYQHWFSDALIQEVTFPALDGSSKDAVYIKVKFQPKAVEVRSATEDLRAFGGAKQKAWICSAFRLSIDGVDGFQYSNKIESFTIKQNVKKLFVGRFREIELTPTKIDFPNLSGTVAFDRAKAIQDWYDRYVVKGQRDSKAQRTGSLEFLAPDRHTTLFRIKLSDVGLLKFHPLQSTANADQIMRMKYELYIGRMELDIANAKGLE